MLATLRPLDPVESAEVFRVVLAAAARPGRILSLPDVGLPPIALVPLVLADLETTIHADLLDGLLADEIRRATGAPAAGPGARIVVTERPRPELIAALEAGTALAPEDGCRLVVACAGLDAADAAVNAPGPERSRGTDAAGIVRTAMTIRGPGVPGEVAITVRGVAPAVIEAIVARNATAPAGIDTAFVAPSGHMAFIPRSATVTLHGTPASESASEQEA